MITYPSTHGVFEETVREICEITHQHGGQVYLDGANMNAMVGLARPGTSLRRQPPQPPQDLRHPAWRGGPGMGPIGVKSHLIPFLPTDPRSVRSRRRVGSPLRGGLDPADLLELLPDDGRRRPDPATKVAILNANYIAARLKGAYDVLYKSAKGRVAA